ncbi:hypothetical protein SDC9_73015 [bioreactor metagenome]|uniref:Uncharacterized protein n=1 Tax=bioreactor metagenome TaxID=1076179 RepID=A0A644YF25_9ZZZZ
MHIQKFRIVMTKSFHLVLRSISPASVPDIDLAYILEKLPFILCMPGSYGVVEQQYMMAMIPV